MAHKVGDATATARLEQTLATTVDNPVLADLTLGTVAGVLGIKLPPQHGSPTQCQAIEGLAREAMTRPDGLAEFLAALRRAIATARPNPAHHALAELEGAGLLDGVLTQSVDGLHQEAGSQEVVEIHGSLLERPASPFS